MHAAENCLNNDLISLTDKVPFHLVPLTTTLHPPGSLDNQSFSHLAPLTTTVTSHLVSLTITEHPILFPWQPLSDPRWFLWHCATASYSLDDRCPTHLVPLTTSVPPSLFPWQPAPHHHVPLTTTVPSHLVSMANTGSFDIQSHPGSLDNQCPIPSCSLTTTFPSPSGFLHNHCPISSVPFDNQCLTHLVPLTTSAPSILFPWEPLTIPSGFLHIHGPIPPGPLDNHCYTHLVTWSNKV